MAARSDSTSGVGVGAGVAVGRGVASGAVERVTMGTVAGAGVGEDTENKLQLTSVNASVVIPGIHLLFMAVHLNWNVSTSVVGRCGSSVAEMSQNVDKQGNQRVGGSVKRNAAPLPGSEVAQI